MSLNKSPETPSSPALPSSSPLTPPASPAPPTPLSSPAPPASPAPPLVVEVAVERPLYTSLHYAVSPALAERLRPGMRLLVPLGTQQVTGYALALAPPPSSIPLKEIIDILDDEPLLDDGLLELSRFAASYLFYPLGEVIKGILPAGINGESIQMIQATPLGRLALQGGHLRGSKALLLQAFSGDESLPVEELLRRAETLASAPLLSSPSPQTALAPPSPPKISPPPKSLPSPPSLSLFDFAPSPVEPPPPKELPAAPSPVLLPPKPPEIPAKKKRFPLAIHRPQIREMIREGFLRSSYHLHRPRVKLPMLRFYKPIEGISLGRCEGLLKRSETQSLLYRLLLERKEATEEDLRILGGLEEKPTKLALRALLKKGLIDTFERPRNADPFFSPRPSPSTPPPLTEAQEKVLHELLPPITERLWQTFLLHGVTGSGKTEVYLRVIAHTLDRGRQAIVLVPEIALTPQFVSVFRRRLGDRMTILHSGLSDRERLEQWWRIKRGEVPLVIGARSALFAPFSDLGAIILDEEQEGTYKQEGAFPYHARSLAVIRAKASKAIAIFGSATPSFESFTLAKTGRWTYLSLPERVHGRPLPAIEVVDLRQKAPEIGGFLSETLADRIRETLDRKEQTILFLNRRGYYNTLLCQRCGSSIMCKDCSVPMTWHRSHGLLLCHHCNFSRTIPDACPRCKAKTLRPIGGGTEKIEEILQATFPSARIGRMDRDTTSQRSELESLIFRFQRQEIDILIGTQMLAKGHDFPAVTLVGVLLADQGLALPDFRASERIFQLLVQVSGRAGRAELPGRVVIQTYNPEHPSITFAQTHDYIGFYTQEAAWRLEHGYPPFASMIAIRIEGGDEAQTQAAAQTLGQKAAVLLLEPAWQGISMLGPAPASLERIKTKWRWQILFKSPHRATLHRFLHTFFVATTSFSHVPDLKILLDVDPLQML